MTTTFDLQFSIQNLIANAPIQKLRGKQQEFSCESGVTTRSGTPEGEGQYSEFSDDSSYDSPIKFSVAEPGSACLDIGVKPKKRQFKTQEEHQRFVDNYKTKIKTELCKNFELRGWCRYGDNCAFAHGRHELQEKIHLHSKYKTKPCQQFHLYGTCNYGNRCQFLHSEALMPNIFYNPSSDVCNNSERVNYSYSLLTEVCRLVAADCKVERILNNIPKK